MDWETMRDNHMHNMMLVADKLPPDISASLDQLLEAAFCEESDKLNQILLAALKEKGFKITSLNDLTNILQVLGLHPEVQEAMEKAAYGDDILEGAQHVVATACKILDIEVINTKSALKKVLNPITNLITKVLSKCG